LIAKGSKPASVNRDMKGFKAALNLAAAHDPRITNAVAWRTGLAALPDAHHARNVVLDDDSEVRPLIAAAYAEDSAFGLLVETAAVTGARVSQLARLEVGDLQANRPDPRLMMPSSRKGKGVKRIERKPVPITSSLAAQLGQAAGNRARTQPLLLRADGRPWQPARADYRKPFIRAVTRVGLDPKIVTLYCLRHSSIVRALLAGVPARVCAGSTIPASRCWRRAIAPISSTTPTRWRGAGCLTQRSQPRAPSSRCPGGYSEQPQRNAADFSPARVGGD
jgi:integrase